MRTLDSLTVHLRCPKLLRTRVLGEQLVVSSYRFGKLSLAEVYFSLAENIQVGPGNFREVPLYCIERRLCGSFSPGVD